MSDLPIASLPPTWRPTQGLTYPMTINRLDGHDVIVSNYPEHHRYIKKLFNSKLDTSYGN